MPLLDPLMFSCNTYMSTRWEIRSFHRELVIKSVATRQTFSIQHCHFSKHITFFTWYTFSWIFQNVSRAIYVAKNIDKVIFLNIAYLPKPILPESYYTRKCYITRFLSVICVILSLGTSFLSSSKFFFVLHTSS